MADRLDAAIERYRRAVINTVTPDPMAPAEVVMDVALNEEAAARQAVRDAAQAVARVAAPEPPDLAALLREADRKAGDAWKALREAIDNGCKLRLTIPARKETDHDIRIGEALALIPRLAAALRRQGELVERGIEGRVSHNFGFSATVDVGAIDWPVGTRVLVRSLPADAARAEGAGE